MRAAAPAFPTGQPGFLQRRELGFRAEIPDAQQILDLIIQTALALEMENPFRPVSDRGPELIDGLIKAYHQVENHYGFTHITQPSDQLRRMRADFTRSYCLYSNTTERYARHLLSWPWYLQQEPQPYRYHERVLGIIGCELGHLMGREQMVLARLQQARASQPEEAACHAHTSG